VVVRKQRYSGFAGTNLDMILKTHGIRCCLYTGVATNVCVETTLRDGYLLDYWPVLVTDACNNSGPEHNRLATEWNVEHAFGWVTTTDEILQALAGT
jgi:ureidoacrylate peracid hydrolase